MYTDQKKEFCAMDLTIGSEIIAYPFFNYFCIFFTTSLSYQSNSVCLDDSVGPLNNYETPEWSGVWSLLLKTITNF